MPPCPSAVQRYLDRRAVQGPWQLEGEAGGRFRVAVVIPSLAEGDSLLRTLDSLATNPAAVLANVLIVVVVNHRVDAEPAAKIRNRDDLRALAQWQTGSGLRLAWVDAATPGREMPQHNSGVGLARKIGLDLALSRLDWSTEPVLVCLDADTLVETNYLAAIRAHFQASTAGAAALAFRHQAAADPLRQAAIDCYELFVRSYVLGLSLAGSPYAFTTIGSAIACRAMTYIRAGGMNRRKAGEDFYFLQQAAKTDGVAPLHGTRVHPSARASARTPFGTGASMTQMLSEEPSVLLFYPVEAFEILAGLLTAVTSDPDAAATQLIDRAGDIAPELADFLERAGFLSAWSGIRRNHARATQRLQAFHVWFDGLKTLRLIHALCAGPCPKQTPDQTLPALFRWGRIPWPQDMPAALEQLRLQQDGGGPEMDRENFSALC